MTVTGVKERGNFAPGITIKTRSGDEFHDELNGNELKWDLATESQRISEIFDEMPWPRAQLDRLVSITTGLDGRTSLAGLIETCVPA